MTGKRPEPKPDGHRSPPQGYPTDPGLYGDPTNFKYPLDTEDRVRAALSYFAQEKNQAEYDAEERVFIAARIKAAAQKFGIETAQKKDADAGEPLPDALKAYPHEHAARISDPGQFIPDSFRRKEIAPGVSIIIAKKKGEPDGAMETQAYRFDREKFTAAEARAWLARNKVEDFTFEAASGATKSEHEGVPGVALTPQDVGEDADFLVSLGGSVKALGNGRVGGFLVTFGDETTPDLSPQRDFFDATTDFDIDEWPAKSTTYYNHGLDPTLGKRRFPRGTMELKDVGVWFESQLQLADDYERAVYALAEAGKIRLSSGVPSHLVERQPVKNATGETVAHRVTYWPLGKDASYTPNPADYRNGVVALKSLDGPPLAELAQSVASPSPSLAENTERWLDRGEELLDVYRRVGTAGMKAGQKLSASRAERLTRAHALIGEILAECAAAEETKDETEAPAAPPEPAVAGMETAKPTQAMRQAYLQFARRHLAGLEN